MCAFSQEQFGSVAIAVLAVNGWSLQKVQELRPALAASGLFDPPNVADATLETLISRLTEAGYDRGNLTWRFAERVRFDSLR